MLCCTLGIILHLHYCSTGVILMPSNATAVWLPQVLIESALIVISILVALGLDEWRQKREDAETAQQALSNFISEVQQNQARVEDAAPFNKGLLDVLKGRYEGSGIDSVDEFVIMAVKLNGDRVSAG